MERKKQLLIIDDEPDFVKTMRFFLEKSGFAVTVAYDGKAGIEKAAMKPDLIILDVRMPGMSGHEVSKKLKEDRFTQDIPIIMLTSMREQTGFDFPGERIHPTFLPVDEYMEKPFEPEVLFEKIEQRLSTKGTG